MNNPVVDKMILAILQNDNHHEVIQDLNGHGFYVTVLHSSGGFLKEPNATILIGLNHEDLDEAIGVLKHYGRRTEIEYKPTTSTAGMMMPPLVMSSVPIPVCRGGIVLFVMDVCQCERF